MADQSFISASKRTPSNSGDIACVTLRKRYGHFQKIVGKAAKSYKNISELSDVFRSGISRPPYLSSGHVYLVCYKSI